VNIRYLPSGEALGKEMLLPVDASLIRVSILSLKTPEEGSNPVLHRLYLTLLYPEGMFILFAVQNRVPFHRPKMPEMFQSLMAKRYDCR
jgi:hypothetical protein